MDYRRVPDNGGRVTGRGSCTISGVTTSAETRPSPHRPLVGRQAEIPPFRRPRPGVVLFREPRNHCDAIKDSRNEPPSLRYTTYAVVKSDSKKLKQESTGEYHKHHSSPKGSRADLE